MNLLYNEYFKMVNESNYLLLKIKERILSLEQEGFAFEFHPLGFVHIDLTNSFCESNICLHFCNKANISPLHNHHFNMTSTILVGCLKNHLIQLVENDKGSYQKYSIMYNPEKKERYLKKVNDINYRIAAQNTTTFYPKEQYFMEAGSYHKSENGTDGPLVTLVIKQKISEYSYCMYENFQCNRSISQVQVKERELTFDEKFKFYLNLRTLLGV